MIEEQIINAMSTLKSDWLTDGLIDFEYKKYIVLGYLKKVKENFDRTALYPDLSDLLFHYKNILSVKKNKQLIYDQFPASISKEDFKKLRLNYEKIVKDDGVMKEIEDILAFSIPCFTDVLNEGKDLYEFVETNMEISAIGLSPLYKHEGYLFIDEEFKKEVMIYRFQVSVFESADEVYRGVNVEFVESKRKSLGVTFERVKLDLVKTYKVLPNPATYAIHTRFKFPYEATLMPVAKRLLVKHITKSAA